MCAGLDSATTFSVTKWLRVICHALQLTTVVSLLQPSPEVFQLFDDVLLLTDGYAVRENYSAYLLSHEQTYLQTESPSLYTQRACARQPLARNARTASVDAYSDIFLNTSE